MTYTYKLPSIEYLREFHIGEFEYNNAIAWNQCTNSSAMVRLLVALKGVLPEHLGLAIQLMALDTPLHNKTRVIDLITDDRLLSFIDIKRKRLNGEVISDESWSNARDKALFAAEDKDNPYIFATHDREAARTVVVDHFWIDRTAAEIDLGWSMTDWETISTVSIAKSAACSFAGDSVWSAVGYGISTPDDLMSPIWKVSNRAQDISLNVTYEWQANQIRRLVIMSEDN